MDFDRREVLQLAALAALGGCTNKAIDAGVVAVAAKKESPMKTRPLMKLRLSTAATQDVGATPHGTRVTFPIVGGDFEGERLRGKVLPGGDDWALKRADGAVELDLRATLQTDDGALIHLTFTGLRDDARSYFRTLPRFETADPKYVYLNRLLAVGIGEIGADGPVHFIEEIV